MLFLDVPSIINHSTFSVFKGTLDLLIDSACEKKSIIFGAKKYSNPQLIALNFG